MRGNEGSSMNAERRTGRVHWPWWVWALVVFVLVVLAISALAATLAGGGTQ